MDIAAANTKRTDDCLRLLNELSRDLITLEYDSYRKDHTREETAKTYYDLRKRVSKASDALVFGIKNEEGTK